MDSRVAITAASILYDIQNLPDDVPKSRELTEEDFKQMSNQFLSCNWRLNDTDEEPDNEPFPALNTDFQSNVTKDQGISINVPHLVMPIETNVHSGELALNGIDCEFFCKIFVIESKSRVRKFPLKQKIKHHPENYLLSPLSK